MMICDERFVYKGPRGCECVHQISFKLLWSYLTRNHKCKTHGATRGRRLWITRVIRISPLGLLNYSVICPLACNYSAWTHKCTDNNISKDNIIFYSIGKGRNTAAEFVCFL